MEAGRVGVIATSTQQVPPHPTASAPRQRSTSPFQGEVCRLRGREQPHAIVLRSGTGLNRLISSVNV